MLQFQLLSFYSPGSPSSSEFELIVSSAQSGKKIIIPPQFFLQHRSSQEEKKNPKKSALRKMSFHFGPGQLSFYLTRTIKNALFQQSQNWKSEVQLQEQNFTKQILLEFKQKEKTVAQLVYSVQQVVHPQISPVILNEFSSIQSQKNSTFQSRFQSCQQSQNIMESFRDKQKDTNLHQSIQKVLTEKCLPDLAQSSIQGITASYIQEQNQSVSPCSEQKQQTQNNSVLHQWLLKNKEFLEKEQSKPINYIENSQLPSEKSQKNADYSQIVLEGFRLVKNQGQRKSCKLTHKQMMNSQSFSLVKSQQQPKARQSSFQLGQKEVLTVPSEIQNMKEQLSKRCEVSKQAPNSCEASQQIVFRKHQASYPLKEKQSSTCKQNLNTIQKAQTALVNTPRKQTNSEQRAVSKEPFYNHKQYFQHIEENDKIPLETVLPLKYCNQTLDYDDQNDRKKLDYYKKCSSSVVPKVPVEKQMCSSRGPQGSKRIRQRKLNASICIKQKFTENRMKKYQKTNQSQQNSSLLSSNRHLLTSPSLVLDSPQESPPGFSLMRHNTAQIPALQLERASSRKKGIKQYQKCGSLKGLSIVSGVNTLAYFPEKKGSIQESTQAHFNRHLTEQREKMPFRFLFQPAYLNPKQKQKQKEDSYSIRSKSLSPIGKRENYRKMTQMEVKLHTIPHFSEETTREKGVEEQSSSPDIQIVIRSVTVLLYREDFYEEGLGKFVIVSAQKGRTFITEIITEASTTLTWKNREYPCQGLSLELSIFEKTGKGVYSESWLIGKSHFPKLSSKRNIKKLFARASLLSGQEEVGTVIIMYDTKEQFSEGLSRSIASSFEKLSKINFQQLVERKVQQVLRSKKSFHANNRQRKRAQTLDAQLSFNQRKAPSRKVRMNSFSIQKDNLKRCPGTNLKEKEQRVYVKGIGPRLERQFKFSTLNVKRKGY